MGSKRLRERGLDWRLHVRVFAFFLMLSSCPQCSAKTVDLLVTF